MPADLGQGGVGLLFVCRANVFRSVMAQAIFAWQINALDTLYTETSMQERQAAWQVCDSAGLSADEELRTPQSVIDLLQSHDIGMLPRRSQLLTAELASSADLVVTMEAQHSSEVRALAPQRWRRVVTLPELAGAASRIPLSPGAPRERLGELVERVSANANTAEVCRGVDDPSPNGSNQLVSCFKQLSRNITLITSALLL